jgi:hypothetical protein
MVGSGFISSRCAAVTGSLKHRSAAVLWIREYGVVASFRDGRGTAMHAWKLRFGTNILAEHESRLLHGGNYQALVNILKPRLAKSG